MIKIQNLCKNYGKICANSDISFDINQGEFVVILGQSGAGKSTLLNILGGIDSATSGSILIEGKDIVKFNKRELEEYRKNNIGFVFQFYNLISNLTAIENVELSTELVKNSMSAKEALDLVGLKDKYNNFPFELSGGEQQRVSIARAISKKTKILLCDEPTGALDYITGKKILKLLHNICRDFNTTVIVITHNKAISEMADKIIEIADSKLKNIIINNNIKDIDEIEW